MRPLLMLVPALALSLAVPAVAAPFMDEGDALIADPAGHWLSLPVADVVLGPSAASEPVPVDGRLGWFVHDSVPGDPALRLGEVHVPGSFQEEALGDYFWVWFTPDDLLIPLAEYTFEYGVGAERVATFRTGETDLAHLDLDRPLTASVESIWYPGSPPFLSVRVLAAVDAEDPGSSRLSVVRFHQEDGTLVAIQPVELDGTAVGWLSAEQAPGSVAPDEVCVSAVHENGLGDLADPVELCADVEIAEGTGVPGGCAFAQASPSRRSAAVLGFLPLLAAVLRRRVRG